MAGRDTTDIVRRLLGEAFRKIETQMLARYRKFGIRVERARLQRRQEQACEEFAG